MTTTYDTPVAVRLNDEQLGALDAIIRANQTKRWTPNRSEAIRILVDEWIEAHPDTSLFPREPYRVTREQAIYRVGLEAVEAVEAANCEPTSALRADGDTTIEYTASVVCKGAGEEGLDVVLTAFYYPDESEFYNDGEPIEDLGNIDWQIAKYEIV